MMMGFAANAATLICRIRQILASPPLMFRSSVVLEDVKPRSFAMSIIGASTGIAAGSASVAALRAVGRSDRTATPQSPVQAGQSSIQNGAAPSAAAFAAGAVSSTALDVGAVPVDHDRVASIKKAISTHTYPLIPARIGDAMIAAGMLLRMPG
jgi:negative regulator of flagellin synthesis FlgM